MRLKDYHDFQLPIAGFSGSGKTTLIIKLIEKLSCDYHIGYAKHDAHKFTMDREGKDTQRAYAAGATQTYVATNPEYAIVGRSLPLKADLFRDCDFVFIEGFKSAPFGKLVFCDEEGDMLKKIEDGEIEHVLATISLSNQPIKANTPHFSRDNIDGIADFILKYFEEKQKAPLYGLLLAGGFSKRMGKDKSQLDYQGEPQYKVVYQLLDQVCDKSFISARTDQDFDLPVINDSYVGKGPIGGILSAMDEEPHAAWMVLACDLPMLSEGVLANLRDQRNPYKIATGYLDQEGKLPEPMCTIYEAHARFELLKFLSLGVGCPRKVLLNTRVKLIELEDKLALANANTPEEYENLRGQLAASK